MALGSIVGAIAAPVVGGLIGNAAAGGARDDASMNRALAMKELLKIELPDLSDDEIEKLLPEIVQQYSAQHEGVETLGPSAYEGISTDPRLKEAQMNALMQLSGVAESGLTEADLAALRGIRREAAGEAQSQQNSILQEMQRRGMGGSGQELAARLQAGQSAADRMSQEGDNLAKMAQERALAAMTQSGNMAGSMRQQDFGEQESIARARDLISQFNTQNRQVVQGRNVDRTNQVNQANVSDANRMAETRQGTKRDLRQQRYANELDRAAAISGQYNREAQAKEDEAGRIANMWSGIGQGAGTGIAAAMNKGK